MIVRGLFEASYVFYGAIGLIIAALMLGAAGFAILATGALPAGSAGSPSPARSST